MPRPDLGDLFAIFPDLPRAFHASRLNTLAIERLQEVKARAEATRALAASLVGRHRVESDLRRRIWRRSWSR
jgi:hypothetical protein